MNIPEGFKLVPVEPTNEMVAAIQDRITVTSRGGKIGCKAALREAIEAAPTPLQPIYDKAKERELFEAFYVERANTLPLALGSAIRYAGGQYVNDFALFGWMVWLECAQSRAKSVGVESCIHDWVDARNQVVKSGELCAKCFAIRSGNATTDGLKSAEVGDE